MEKKATTMQTVNDVPVKIMCWGNNYYAPCTDPLTLKLQTYMRMAGIKHEVKSCVMSSQQGKVPFVQVNGKQIEDSTTVLNYLNREYGKNLNSNLNNEDIEKAFRFRKTVEDNLRWSLEFQKWFLDDKIAEIFPLTNWFFRFIFNLTIKYKIRPELQRDIEIHLGVCTSEELIRMAERDLTSLSQHLEDKPFFMGKEPSEIDATMFGFLGVLLNGMENSASSWFVRQNLPNLVAYVDRMKAAYWPDWEELCSPRSNSASSGRCQRQSGKVGYSSKVNSTVS